MQDIFKVPITKIIHYRLFWTLAILIFGLTLMGTYFLWYVSQNPFEDGKSLPGASLAHLFTASQIWMTSMLIAKMCTYFLSLLLILIVSSDFEYDLLKQHMIDGWSRGKAALSYLFVSFFFSLIPLFLVFCIVLFFGGFSTFFQSLNLNVIGYLGRFILHCLLTFQFVVFLTLLLKKSVPTIIMLTSWLIIIEPLLKWNIDNKIYDGGSVILPFTLINKVLNLPNTLLGPQFAAADDTSLYIVFFGVLYLGIIYLNSWMKIKYTEF